MNRADPPSGPVAALVQLGALWSPDFDAYASGQLAADRVRCVLCVAAPCECPPFGSPEYLALLDARHGRAGSAGDELAAVEREDQDHEPEPEPGE